jgi:PleD family two-component response regulator
MITLDSLIATADKLLYDAKTGGRNQVKSLQLS